MQKKKDYIVDTIRQEKIDICLIQEAEIPKDYPTNLLSSKDYNIECENNTVKARCAALIKNTINYTRRQELEGEDSCIIVLDIHAKKTYRIINVYRTFNPPANITLKDNFSKQINLISNALLADSNITPIILGDFNLDDSKQNDVQYRNKSYFEVLNLLTERHHLIQLIKFPTWHRMINNATKSSILDHVYVKNPTIVEKLYSFLPLIGDHLLISFNINETPDAPTPHLKRNWKNYSKDTLLQKLSLVDFDCVADDVQTLWNHFECVLINIIDEIVPYESFVNNQTIKSAKPTPHVKSKIYLRRRLLKSFKKNNNPVTNLRIKNLNVEIKQFFTNQRRSSIQRSILPNNSKSLWQAVKIAKNLQISNLPKEMYCNDLLIPKLEMPDVFADYFVKKIENIVNETIIDNNVYNGKKKLNVENTDFMQLNDVLNAVKSLKVKNCEGHDRIPQRILVDGIQFLLQPLSVIFNKIYLTKTIPEQWLIAKVNPIFKKGNPRNVENYRPISNLCSASKIFEKLILLKIQNLEKQFNVDLTGKPQHGFKPKHSTTTASLLLQSILARATDGDKYAVMASLDLSAAFDVVNVELLIKRLKIIGLPVDLIDLVSKWLTVRYFYVTIEGVSSYIRITDVGTVQGSILGPILYAMFVSPLFDLAKLTLYADDNYIIRWNTVLELLIDDMKTSLEMITKWLKQSGLKVNDGKTELCVFHRNDPRPIELFVNNIPLKSKNCINVLGITFDSKLQWHLQVNNAITKSKRALHAINLIRKYFTQKQLLDLITSNYLSILYYNADIWLLPSLAPILKTKLLSASAAPLKLCTRLYDNSMSYETLHTINNRANPSQFSTYRHAILLHKTYNDTTLNNNWLDLFFNQHFNGRCNTVNFVNTKQYKIGNNLLSNRFVILNGKINYEWLNLPFESYKLKCKALFL